MEEKLFKSKNKFFKKRGFTLIELLLVIAIIGILAGAVFAMIGDSSNAKTKSALSTAKSIMPYAQECLFKTDSLPTTPSVGNKICSSSDAEWPELSSDCQYVTGSPSTWNIQCNLTSVVTIKCDAQNGECQVIP